MGRLAVMSVQAQDYAYVQAIILIIAVMVVVTNLVVELAYGWADPEFATIRRSQWQVKLS